ncbi:MAG: histidine kinase [Alphaproteobacteria bacterium]|nr:MAG: histidine kinase [Alphaproteobacteria bacterium]
MATHFRSGIGAGANWATAVKACLGDLGEVPAHANLGFIYATDVLSDDLSSILTFLRATTDIEHWVGTLGHGIAGTGTEHHDTPAVAILVAALAPETFRVFEPITLPADQGGFETWRRRHGGWLERAAPHFAIVHADPRTPAIERLAGELAAQSGSFLLGGLAAVRGASAAPIQIAEQVVDGGLSGVLFTPEVGVVTGLSQGCSPIGPRHTVTGAAENVVTELDGRPALDVFKEDIGELLARDLRRVAGYIHVGLPVVGSDTGDYMVRNLTGIDVAHGFIGIGGPVVPGQPILFCRRDHESARTGLIRMVRSVKHRAGACPKAAIYVSCVGRGRHLFGPNSEELRLVQAELGPLPLAGFFAGGEICHDRLYGYTGVLAVFT